MTWGGTAPADPMYAAATYTNVEQTAPIGDSSSTVVNAATPKAKITYEAAIALSQHGTVAPVTLHHRTDFAASMIDGRTVMEVDPNGRSAREVTELWDYVADRLEKNFRRTVFSAPGAPTAHPAMPRPIGGFGRRVAGQ